MSASNITFADVVHQAISFSPASKEDALLLDLIDDRWVQRLRDISQTANTRLVYMFSEHSRFGHSLGVAFLANMVMHKLAESYPDEIEPYRQGVSAAALLHDIGHLAPGSHTAYKTWFPNQEDKHESVACRIIKESKSLQGIFARYSDNLPDLVCRIILEDSKLPPWTWEIISGGGWNVDRGNWCMVDSILAGVSYGKYNIPALIESIVITGDKHLALKENRLDAMMHFAVSRHAMYRQIYQHRVLLAADCLNKAVVMRARDLGSKLEFADEYMRKALDAQSPADLNLETVYSMRESWWRYHLMRWCDSNDRILADLAERLFNRRLFKTIRVRETDNEKNLLEQVCCAAITSGYDPRYYVHRISTHDMHAGDDRQSMLVLMDDGRIKNLSDAEPLFSSMVRESKGATKSWIALPADVKLQIGRTR
ncbi:MAG: HD domain-containing protein [Deltaproteobacteria bacterium]|nr:HD domain-containing protein [Deltaproteobacteria bacterium]